jgi:hypothetical protein
MSPPGALCPLGVKLSPGVKILCSLLRFSKQYLECVNPYGGEWREWAFPLGYKAHPWGPSSPLEQTLRPILNFTPRGKLWPPGAKLSPRGEFVPWGWNSLFAPSILLNNKVCSSLRGNEGGNFTPRGQISPLGDKFTPRGEIHPWEPGVKLRMALWLL